MPAVLKAEVEALTTKYLVWPAVISTGVVKVTAPAVVPVRLTVPTELELTLTLAS